jgi:hypothetical protein
MRILEKLLDEEGQFWENELLSLSSQKLVLNLLRFLASISKHPFEFLDPSNVSVPTKQTFVSNGRASCDTPAGEKRNILIQILHLVFPKPPCSLQTNAIVQRFQQKVANVDSKLKSF